MKKPKLIQRQIDFLNTLKDGSVALMITEFQTEGKLRYKGYFFVAGEFPIDDVRTKADGRSIRSLIKWGFLEKTNNRVVEKNIARHQWQITRNKCTCFLRWKEEICPFQSLNFYNSNRRILYTIGHKEGYINLYKKQGVVHKVGKHVDYPGGYVFKTMADAEKCVREAYQDSEFGIFGLKAVWGVDTEQSVDGWWHNLLNDSEIIILKTCTCCPSCQLDCYGRNLSDDINEMVRVNPKDIMETLKENSDDPTTMFTKNSKIESTFLIDDPTPFTEKDFNEITNE